MEALRGLPAAAAAGSREGPAGTLKLGLFLAQRDLKIRSPEPYGKLYRDYVGVIMGLYRGSNLGTNIIRGYRVCIYNMRFV